MASKNHNQFKMLPNQSKFHEELRKIFCESRPFSNMKCYQEVPVTEINPQYGNSQHRYDWYIEELHVVIELHGKQHYEPTNFGNEDGDQVRRNFNRMRYRDNAKMQAAKDAGASYIAIPYKLQGKLNAELILKLITES